MVIVLIPLLFALLFGSDVGLAVAMMLLFFIWIGFKK